MLPTSAAFFRGYCGSDLPSVNPHIRFITCPFTGESLATVPTLRPNITIIHAQKADQTSNVLIEGIIGVQKEAVLAAKRSVVTVEEIVDELPVSPVGKILKRQLREAIALKLQQEQHT